ncbi:hypothetical protein PT276_02440 [Orbaceae bacterium ESL0721]|nr:hypothetical protein [Orbaceae bacterium ESL0721]
MTKQTVIGSHPYFTFDGGKTKIESAEGLLDITLSDGSKYSKSNNPSSPDKLIELPDTGQSFEDITTAIPKTLSQINLNDLVHEPYNFWGDDNGDGEGEGGVTATGNITMTISDVWGQNVKRSTILSVCNSPYKMTLSVTGILSTQYGDPKSSNLGEAEATYYFRPKAGLPITCWAQPNLDYSSTHLNPLAPDNSHFEFYQLDGPASQWDPDKGYILQSLTNSTANFPTMGAHGLFFNLLLGDGVGSNLTYSKSPASSGINLNITDAGNNSAKVMLTGPRNGATPTYAATAVPTTFTIYSDAAKTNAIYRFTISKWFIAKPGDAGVYDANFCRNSYGGNYRFPKLIEYTNGNSPDQGWTGGLAGQPANYQRRIGGGLFAEWGNMDNYGRWGHKSIYQDSDFDDVWYWSSDGYNATEGYYADSYSGWVFHMPYIVSTYRYACVTP